MSVSIVLPCFNERDNICVLIKELLLQLQSVSELEIIVVDDNSPDGTANQVLNEFKNNSHVKLINRFQNPGLAASIRCGIEQAANEVIVVMDTDFNHEPKDVPLMYSIASLPVVDMVLGSRFLCGGASTSRIRYLLSYWYNLFMNLALRTNITDNLSGFFAIKKSQLYKIDFDKIFWGYGDYYFRLLVFTQKLKFTHIQIPIRYGFRKSGQSKTRFLKIFSQYTWEVMKLLNEKALGRI